MANPRARGDKFATRSNAGIGRKLLGVFAGCCAVVLIFTFVTTPVIEPQPRSEPSTNLPSADTVDAETEATIRVRSRMPRSVPVAKPLIPESALNGPSVELNIIDEKKTCNQSPPEGGVSKWVCVENEDSSVGEVRLTVRVTVRRPAEMLNRHCSLESWEYWDALEISAVSPVALLAPQKISRVATFHKGLVAEYDVEFAVFESAEYHVMANVRFFCGAQYSTLMSSSTGPIAKAPKPYPDWVKRWGTIGSSGGLSQDLAARWTAKECVVDSTLVDDERHAIAPKTQWMAVMVVNENLRRAPPAIPSCVEAPGAVLTTRSPGRWVNLRRLFLKDTATCQPPFCSGDASAMLYGDDPIAAELPQSYRGWVYVPYECYLHFPSDAAEAWNRFNNSVLVLLGDSTTSDTLYHLLKTVFRSESSPPRNRWSDPFEMIVRAPSSSASGSFVLRQNRIGNMERDRASGWFDNLRGLEHFHAPYQIGKVREWVGKGRSVVKTFVGATELNPEDALATKSDVAARRSDVEGPDDKIATNGFADAVIVHSGPHDRRRPGHTLEQYRRDLKHMRRIMDAALREAKEGSPKQPLLLWRSNIVGAGPYYRCSRLENPWIYRAMDGAATETLRHSDEARPSAPWATLDAASITDAFHWGLRWSDGIHYGRYMARYRKLTTVDRVVAIMLWNALNAHLAQR